MASSTNDGSEDVNDFLRRIKELGDKRDREDEERTRKLEDDIIQGRKEREARRAERARSISPVKKSPNTSARSSPAPSSNFASVKAYTGSQSAATASPPTPPARMDGSHDNSRTASVEPDLTEQPTKPTTAQSSDSLARSGTLSWQQRPPSRGSPSSRSRPLSLVGASSQKPISPKPTPEPGNIEEKEVSRAQIAHSLGGKDPSWFRQTPERGLKSAALRKNEGAAPDTGAGSASFRLHGISREPVSEPELEETPSSRYSSTRNGNLRTSSGFKSSPPANSRSPLPVLSSQVFDPPSQPSTSPSNVDDMTQGLANRQSLRRLSPERVNRPASPTKGLGGFVQSAMMKRSDSVNKRWSAQGGSGLSRSSSTVSNKGAPEQPAPFFSSSSQSATPSLNLAKPGSPENADIFNASTSVPSLERKLSSSGDPSRSDDLKLEQARQDPLRTSPPATGTTVDDPLGSPSKRWSPTKSSWLENAINKPDNPKFKPAQPQQPSWMAEISKAKQNRGSVDLTKPPSHHEVMTGGLLRSPPMGLMTKSTSLDYISIAKGSSRPASPSKEQARNEGDMERELTSPLPESEQSRKPKESTQSILSGIDKGNEKSKPPVLSPKPLVTRLEKPASLLQGNASLAAAPAKPETPPKKDLRTGLKPHGVSAEKSTTEEAEFKNVFGKLRKTETKNYVAPDLLKDNILRGKAGLNMTGGPKKTQRVDEFKESILKKKAAMKAGETLSATGTAPPLAKATETVVPEALAKRREMSGKPLITQKPAQVASNQVKTRIDKIPVPSKLETSEASEKEESRHVPKPALAAIDPKDNVGSGFNAKLAGILCRGLPTAAPTVSESNRSKTIPSTPEQGGQDPQLQHATKGRARGPKRRPPTSASSETSIKAQASVPITSLQMQEVSNDERNGKPVPSPKTQLKSVTWPPKSRSAIQDDQAHEYLVQTDSNTISEAPVTSTPQKPIVPSKTNFGPTRPLKEPGVLPPKSPMMTGLRTTKLKVVEVTPSAEHEIVQTGQNSEQVAPIRPPKSPPIPNKKASLATIATSPPLHPSNSPDMQLANTEFGASATFAQYFDGFPFSKVKAEFDTSAILNDGQRRPDEKIKTLGKELFELTSDGKKIPVQSQQEHILFESCMYLCVHHFGLVSTGKRKTEVYLWHGRGVSSSAVEDAQLFARNAAKEAGAKLTLISQGKESSAFFEALGGITVTRRGTPKSAPQTYTLCGRRHLGHIAFDEVNMSPTSLCSGFPFLVAAIGGRLLLWKGFGSGADELGCARLIGMDLGLSGEIEEINEGEEPPTFWNAFGLSSAPIRPPPGNWRLKASSEKYMTRLYSVEAEGPRPKSSCSFIWGRRGSTPAVETPPGTYNAEIKEIIPYAQSDLVKTGIFVLDAFFEIFVIVGDSSNAKFPAFRTALLFAQDYAILSASEEDRPFVPASKVVLAGAPDGLKAAFRAWDDANLSTRKTDGRSQIIFPVSEAISATNT